MRALTVILALLATVAGAYGGFAAMRALGPEDLTGQYGRGAAALDGNLMQSRNFTRVVEALERELGADGRLQNVNVELLEADATATVGKRMVRVEIDAAGRSQQRDIGEATPTGTMPVSKLDPRALDRITRAARRETGAPVESLSLYAGGREWRVEMLRGEPDSFIANLNGRGLRLSGEPNPEPAGAAPDSMLRAENLQKVLDAAAKEGSRVLDLTVWPERASIQVERGGREVSLDFGYDAELTSRNVSAMTGAPSESMPLSRIDSRAIERMAAHRRAKGLKRAQYAILRSEPIENTPEWLLYLPEGNEPPYLTADIEGRGISWPGR